MVGQASATMLFSNVKGMGTIYTVPRRQKGSASKIQGSCPYVIKMHNKGMGGVDLTDQRAPVYHLDLKSTIRFYKHIFVDLMVAACPNSYIVYNMVHPNDLTLLYFKLFQPTCL